MQSNWLAYWQINKHFDEYMQKNATCFLNKIQKYITIHHTDFVLDFGCGPGYLADAWHNRVALFHGIDISERYITKARSKHATKQNVQFFWLNPQDYLNLHLLNNSFYNLVIVMSVLQYFESEEEVKFLLEQLVQKVKPGGKILLADLIVREFKLKDFRSIFFQAIKNKHLYSTLSFFIRLRFSAYYKLKQEKGLLIISVEKWCKILKQMNLNYKVVQEPITLQKERKSIIITV